MASIECRKRADPYDSGEGDRRDDDGGRQPADRNSVGGTTVSWRPVASAISCASALALPSIVPPESASTRPPFGDLATGMTTAAAFSRMVLNMASSASGSAEASPRLTTTTSPCSTDAISSRT